MYSVYLILTLFRLVSLYMNKVLGPLGLYGNTISLRNRSTEDLIVAVLPKIQLKHYLWEKRDQQDTQIKSDTSGNVANSSAVHKKKDSHILDHKVGKD